MCDTDFIKIDHPCNKNWIKMQPTENGRHCNSCQTTVIDFSNMHPEKIKSYLLAHSGQHLCGRFKEELVEQKMALTHYDFKRVWPNWIKHLASFILMAGLEINSSRAQIPARRYVNVVLPAINTNKNISNEQLVKFQTCSIKVYSQNTGWKKVIKDAEVNIEYGEHNYKAVTDSSGVATFVLPILNNSVHLRGHVRADQFFLKDFMINGRRISKKHKIALKRGHFVMGRPRF